MARPQVAAGHIDRPWGAPSAHSGPRGNGHHIDSQRRLGAAWGSELVPAAPPNTAQRGWSQNSRAWLCDPEKARSPSDRLPCSKEKMESRGEAPPQKLGRESTAMGNYFSREGRAGLLEEVLGALGERT